MQMQRTGSPQTSPPPAWLPIGFAIVVAIMAGGAVVTSDRLWMAEAPPMVTAPAQATQ